MKKSDIKPVSITALIVTSYISFILVVINAGMKDGFMILWLRSWFIAYVLAVPSLVFISPLIKKK